MKAVAETPTVLAARGRDRPWRESSSSKLMTTGEEGVLRSAGVNAHAGPAWGDEEFAFW